MVSSAQMEAGRQVEAAEEARLAVQGQLDMLTKVRLEEASAYALKAAADAAELQRLREQLAYERPRVAETRIQLAQARAEAEALRIQLREGSTEQNVAEQHQPVENDFETELAAARLEAATGSAQPAGVVEGAGGGDPPHGVSHSDERGHRSSHQGSRQSSHQSSRAKRDGSNEHEGAERRRPTPSRTKSRSTGSGSGSGAGSGAAGSRRPVSRERGSSSHQRRASRDADGR